MIVVFIPAFLYGGIIPLILESAAFRRTASPGSAGRMYSTNTAGAALGILVTPVLLAQWFSYSYLLYLSGLILIAQGIALRFLFPIQKSTTKDKQFSPARIKRHYLTLAFLSGTLSIIGELVLLRTASVYWPSSAFAYPVALFWFLIGLAGGGWIASYVVKRLRILGPLFLLSASALIVGVYLRSFVDVSLSLFGQSMNLGLML